MSFYGFMDFLDIATFIILCITTWYSWKLYKLLPAQLVTFLFIGFFLSTFLQIGFIIINYLPMSTSSEPSWNRFLGELTVALRFVPITLIMVGIISLTNTVISYINGKNKKF